jgi:outer membrane biosynthesis protein TonB
LIVQIPYLEDDMTNRFKLLAAVASLALPAAVASAQTVAPPPVEEPVTPTTNTATEDVQTTARPTPQAPEPVNQNAEPATQAEVTTQAQTATPPQPQATPPQAPAQATTSVQAQASAPAQPAADAGPTVLATAADIRAGVQVRDQTGGAVGSIESVDATGAVVATGTVRAKLPLTSFGRNNQGLVISLTRAQLEAAAQQAAPTPG